MEIVVFANERMIGKIAWLVKVFPGANPLFEGQVSHLRRVKGKRRQKPPAQFGEKKRYPYPSGQGSFRAGAIIN